MKRIEREFAFSPEQQNKVENLSRKVGLTPTTAGILYARGIDTAEKMQAFLHPSTRQLLSPFLMRGMKEAVELLTRAKEEDWKVAVFGDYDADGIGALAIMKRALTAFGIEPYLYVPERADGYGMSISSLDKIFDEFLPDLIVTVDCGISNRNEVEYAKEQGAYVIVTDHHELPDNLPECIVVNPKLKDDYPYDNLCGAGVAFKLAQALIGEAAFDLLDFAALSTVADSVPLTGENRIIVAEGLKRISASPRSAFSVLLGKNLEDVTAQTLAFTVAPRINAAGRMGDAASALQLFLTEDEGEILSLAQKLNSYNFERQKSCDVLYEQARARALEEGAYRNIVMLAGEEWNAGFVGIVAARLTEEFSRPVLLFVRHGDMLKGSARSVEQVNIFEALKSCSQYIEEFGGHAQAAGINVKVENFEALKNALDEYIGMHYEREAFDSVVTVCAESAGADKRLAREINALEPFGIGNRRPLFSLQVESLNASLLKPLSPHVSIAGGELDYMYFGGARELKRLKSDLKKTLVFEYNLSHFRGKEYLKGFVRTVVYGDEGRTSTYLAAFENAVATLRYSQKAGEKMNVREMNEFLRAQVSECAYGLCAVYYERDTLSKFSALNGMTIDAFRPATGSVCNTVLYAPDEGIDLSAYREIVFLDQPLGCSVNVGKAHVVVNDEIVASQALRSLDVSRENLLRVFTAIRNGGELYGDSYAEVAMNCNALGLRAELFIFALAVFEELELLRLASGTLTLFRGKHTDLSNSAIYRALLKAQAEG